MKTIYTTQYFGIVKSKYQNLNRSQPEGLFSSNQYLIVELPAETLILSPITASKAQKSVIVIVVTLIPLEKEQADYYLLHPHLLQKLEDGRLVFIQEDTKRKYNKDLQQILNLESEFITEKQSTQAVHTKPDAKTIDATPEDGLVTAWCHAVWDLVWMMHCNKPTQVRIVAVSQKGFSRKGWGGITQEKEVITEYMVAYNIRNHDYSSGAKAPRELFSSKRELLDSLV